MAINEEAKKKVSRIRSHKKVWYTIISPKIFGQRELGESYLTTPQTAIGRTVKVNLKDITNNVKDQNSYLWFKIDRLEGSKLHSYVVGFELMPSFVKRLVRKNADRLDDYFSFTNKDNKKVIVKTVMITMSKIHRSIQAKLRKQLNEFLHEEITKTDFDTLMSAVANYKIQGSIKKRLSKVYPLKEVAFRVIKLQEQMQSPSEAAAEITEAQSSAQATAKQPVQPSEATSE